MNYLKYLYDQTIVLFRILLDDLSTPSKVDEPPHTRAAVGAWHAVAGMLPGIIMSGMGWSSPIWVFLLILLVYWLLKEQGDLSRGGYWQDGIEDATTVAFGTWVGYAIGWTMWWPVVALNIILISIFILHTRGSYES